MTEEQFKQIKELLEKIDDKLLSLKFFATIFWLAFVFYWMWMIGK